MIELIGEEFDALILLCSPLTTTQWQSPTCLPGWSVKDIVSHLYGIEATLLGEEPPDIEVAHLTHMKNELAINNEMWVESMRKTPGEEVLDRFRSAAKKRMDALTSMTQADFDAPSWTPAGPNETYGRFMRIRHFDCYVHELDVTMALGLGDPTDPRHLASALKEPEAALGFIIGKLAKVPPEKVVEIQLRGLLERTWRIEVSDRARLVGIETEELSASLGTKKVATVVLTMDALLFLRLSGGRLDPTSYLDQTITISGDHELGVNIATHLAYMI